MKEPTFSRRDILKYGIATVSIATVGRSFAQESAAPVAAPSATGPFTLPPLPYAVDELEPYIDAQTMAIHHGKHHAGYVAKLNEAISQHPELGTRPIEHLLDSLDSLPEGIRTAVRNHGGGHHNHSLFWAMMRKEGGGKPHGELAAEIDKAFGSFDGFKEAFTKAALGVFGSGWAWLTLSPEDTFTIIQLPNQDSPLSIGHSPLLGLDVWEHAYYLKYQNRRADYVAAWFNVVNWAEVESLWFSLVKGD